MLLEIETKFVHGQDKARKGFRPPVRLFNISLTYRTINVSRAGSPSFSGPLPFPRPYPKRETAVKKGGGRNGRPHNQNDVRERGRGKRGEKGCPPSSSSSPFALFTPLPSHAHQSRLQSRQPRSERRRRRSRRHLSQSGRARSRPPPHKHHRHLHPCHMAAPSLPSSLPPSVRPAAKPFSKSCHHHRRGKEGGGGGEHC